MTFEFEATDRGLLFDIGMEVTQSDVRLRDASSSLVLDLVSETLDVDFRIASREGRRVLSVEMGFCPSITYTENNDGTINIIIQGLTGTQTINNVVTDPMLEARLAELADVLSTVGFSFWLPKSAGITHPLTGDLYREINGTAYKAISAVEQLLGIGDSRIGMLMLGDMYIEQIEETEAEEPEEEPEEEEEDSEEDEPEEEVAPVQPNVIRRNITELLKHLYLENVGTEQNPYWMLRHDIPTYAAVGPVGAGLTAKGLIDETLGYRLDRWEEYVTDDCDQWFLSAGLGVNLDNRLTRLEEKDIADVRWGDEDSDDFYSLTVGDTTKYLMPYGGSGSLRDLLEMFVKIEPSTGVYGTKSLYDLYIIQTAADSTATPPVAEQMKNISELLRHLSLQVLNAGTENETTVMVSDLTFCSTGNIIAGGVGAGSGGSGGGGSLASLVDTTISSPTPGQLLMYDSLNGWVNASLALAGLSDVSSTAPQDGQVLMWDDTNDVWVPASVSGSGSGGSVTVVNKAATIGTDLTTIAQIDSTNITAKIPTTLEANITIGTDQSNKNLVVKGNLSLTGDFYYYGAHLMSANPNTTLGTNAGPWAAIYGTAIYEGGTSLATKYLAKPSSASNGQVLTYVIPEGETTGSWVAQNPTGEGSPDAVLYISQTLSAEQKAQARTNIGAGTYSKPSGGIPSTDIANGVIPDVTGKADKVTSATNGHFAGLDSNGNLTDSGKQASDFLATVTYNATSKKLTKTISGSSASDVVSASTIVADGLPDGTTDGQVLTWKVTQGVGAWAVGNAGTGGDVNVIESISVNGDPQNVTDKNVDITVPVEATVSGWGFTKSVGTITGITMNGASKGTSGVVNLGTVLTEHQFLGLYAGQDETTANAEKSDPYILLAGGTSSNKVYKGGVRLVGGENITIESDDAGNITITGSGEVQQNVPAADANTIGGFKTGYTNTGTNRGVALDANNRAYVTQVQANWTEATSTAAGYILNKPDFAEVATSGSYNDLSDKPSIPQPQIQADWNQNDDAAKDYIKNKPEIPVLSAYLTKANADSYYAHSLEYDQDSKNLLLKDNQYEHATLSTITGANLVAVIGSNTVTNALNATNATNDSAGNQITTSYLRKNTNDTMSANLTVIGDTNSDPKGLMVGNSNNTGRRIALYGSQQIYGTASEALTIYSANTTNLTNIYRTASALAISSNTDITGTLGVSSDTTISGALTVGAYGTSTSGKYKYVKIYGSTTTSSGTPGALRIYGGATGSSSTNYADLYYASSALQISKGAAIGGNTTISGTLGTTGSLSVGDSDHTQKMLYLYGSTSSALKIYSTNATNYTDIYRAASELVISSSVKIGTSGTGLQLTVYGNISATGNIIAGVSSDRRLKKDIKTIDLNDAADILTHLNPVEYDWNDKALELGSLYGHSRGFIADEYLKLLPNAGRKIWGDYDAIDYNQVIPYIVAGWQQQDLRLRIMEEEIKFLREENERLNRRVRSYALQ